MINYQPHTAKQIAEMDLVPDGTYPFEITDAEEKKSKAGNDMLVIDLNIFTAEGRRIPVKDYIVPGTNYGDKKLFHFAQSIGIVAEYNARTISADSCRGRGGYAQIGTDKGKEFVNKNGETVMGNDKNGVRWYKKSADGAAATPVAGKIQPTEKQLANQSDAGIDEDVPF